MQIGFAGLGVMGAPLAALLSRAGHDLTVYNRTPEKARAWVTAHGGRVARSPADLGLNAECLVLCVGRDADVREIVLSALPTMRPGSLIVDHTTTSARLAQDLSTYARACGHAFLDAPVSGGQRGAQEGALTIMVGGEPEDFVRAEPMLRGYARAVRYMGPAGAGQLTKMVNQICIAGLLQGLAEALHFARCAGLDTAAVYEAISKGAAQSWQMDNRWSSMCEGRFDFGFAVDWMRKDLGLILDEGRRNGARLTMTALVDDFYAQVQELGGARWDTSSLVTRLREPAIAPLPALDDHA